MEEILNNQPETTQFEKLTKDQRYYRKKKAKEKEKDEKLSLYSFLIWVLLGIVIGLLFHIWKREKEEEIEKKEEKPTFPLPYIPVR
jgi:hypothetical protein